MVNNFLLSILETNLQQEPHNLLEGYARDTADRMVFDGEVFCLPGHGPCDCLPYQHMQQPLNLLCSHISHNSSLLVMKIAPDMDKRDVINSAFKHMTQASNDDMCLCFLFEHEDMDECPLSNVVPFQHMLNDQFTLFMHVLPVPVIYTIHICNGDYQDLAFISPISGRFVRVDSRAVAAAQAEHYAQAAVDMYEGELYSILFNV